MLFPNIFNLKLFMSYEGLVFTLDLPTSSPPPNWKAFTFFIYFLWFFMIFFTRVDFYLVFCLFYRQFFCFLCICFFSLAFFFRNQELALDLDLDLDLPHISIPLLLFSINNWIETIEAIFQGFFSPLGWAIFLWWFLVSFSNHSPSALPAPFLRLFFPLFASLVRGFSSFFAVRR